MRIYAKKVNLISCRIYVLCNPLYRLFNPLAIQAPLACYQRDASICVTFNVAYLIALLMVSTIYLTSSSVTYGPEGRHMPTLKMASDTPFI